MFGCQKLDLVLHGITISLDSLQDERRINSCTHNYFGVFPKTE